MERVSKEEESEEVEIDLDSSEEDCESGEDPEVLWKKAPPAVEDEDSIHTSALVEISDTKPLINSRDPRGINDALKVNFEDVIAEPPGAVRSGDRVWLWSHALFEVSRVWIYRVASVLLAIPLSIITGLMFALLSCLHIWMVGPCLQCVLIGTRWLQSLWSIVMDVIVQPLFTSASRCCGGFSVHLAEE